LGTDVENEKQLTPRKLVHSNNFIDIASHWHYSISTALSQNGSFFVWGRCGKEKIRTPKETDFNSFHEIFANYCGITHQTFGKSTIQAIAEPIETAISYALQNGKYEHDYKELNVISEGHFGVVCNACKLDENFNYAIKKIPITNEEMNRQAFQNELNLLLKSKSAFVVHYFQAWIEENYLVKNGYTVEQSSGLSSSHQVFNPNKPLLLHIQMELCSFTLKDAISKLNQELDQKTSKIMTPLGYFISSELFTEILECCDYLHKQNPPIIHRDLKPANILITGGKSGKFIKVADFGLATIHKFDNQSHTKYKGTSDYRAPEVTKSRKYDMKADIYSLGVIIEELFNIDINK